HQSSCQINRPGSSPFMILVKTDDTSSPQLSIIMYPSQSNHARARYCPRTLKRHRAWNLGLPPWRPAYHETTTTQTKIPGKAHRRDLLAQDQGPFWLRSRQNRSKLSPL